MKRKLLLHITVIGHFANDRYVSSLPNTNDMSKIDEHFIFLFEF